MGATIDRGKTGLVDFSSEFAGGRGLTCQALGTRCCAQTRCDDECGPSVVYQVRVSGSWLSCQDFAYASALHPLFRRAGTDRRSVDREVRWLLVFCACATLWNRQPMSNLCHHQQGCWSHTQMCVFMNRFHIVERPP